MDGKVLARLGAIVFIAVAITATAIEMGWDEEPAENGAPSGAVMVPSDPLRDELLRCQALGEAGPHDPACRRAWAENRQRFLTPSARRVPDEPPPPSAAPLQPDEAL